MLRLPVPHVPGPSFCWLHTRMQAMPTRHSKLVSGHTICVFVLPLPGGHLRAEPRVRAMRCWQILADPGHVLHRLSSRRVCGWHGDKHLYSVPTRDLLEPECKHKLHSMPVRLLLRGFRCDYLPAMPEGAVLEAKHVFLPAMSTRNLFRGERQLIMPAVRGRDVFHRSRVSMRAVSTWNVQQQYRQISMPVLQKRYLCACRIPRGSSRFFFLILALSLPPSYPLRISRYRTSTSGRVRYLGPIGCCPSWAAGPLVLLTFPDFPQCEDCPAGTYGTGLLGASWDCHGCGTGRFSILSGATSSDTCERCAAGSFTILLRASVVSAWGGYQGQGSHDIEGSGWIEGEAGSGEEACHVLCFSATHSAPSYSLISQPSSGTSSGICTIPRLAK